MSTVKTAIGRFVWHDHISNDPNKARDFYSKLLGWKTEVFMPGEMDYPAISVDGETHGGFGPAQGGAPPHWLGHIAVEDVDETVTRAEAAGGSVLAPAMDIPEVGRMAVMRDPQGAAFSVFSSASEDWNPTGGVFVWDELHTTDVEGAKAFYREVVGWSANDTDMGGGVTYTIFESGGEQRGGCMMIRQPDMPPNWLTYIGVDDVDGKCKEAEDLGAQKMVDPMDIPGVGRFAGLIDPTGAAFALYKPSES